MIAQTILKQIGGKAFLMLGMNNVVSYPRGVQFGIKGSKEINKVQIMLEPNDTYTCYFWKIRGVDGKLVRTCGDVYAEQLNQTISLFTNLATSL